ncbi:MAG TPA: branched-chain amino acid ABC transporter permease [Pseudolabrys sp.]|nr:branched-chain amino acid ABC transporter permease [Pseudolabrys sp.]
MAVNEGSEAVAGKARERAASYLIGRHRFRAAEALPWLLAIAAFFLFPDRMTFGNQALIMVMFALSLDLILGYAGIVSLGHAAFFGVGAYTVGLLIARLDWSEPLSSLFAAAVLSGLIGFVTGWFILRYRGLTVIMLTLATAIMLQEAGNLRSDISGGYDGLPGLVISPLFGVFEYDLYGHVNYLYVLGVLAVIFYIVRRIVYSPFGQALTGIRENVRRMNAIGSPVHRRLVTVYTISAAIAGIAGALFTQTNAYVTLTVFDFDNSAKVMVMLILGGTGRLYGAFIGAVVYMILEDHLSKLSPTFWQFGIGLLLILAVLFAPRGLMGLFEDIGRGNWRRARAAATRRFAWKREHWAVLAGSAFDGAAIGFIIGFAVNFAEADLISEYIASLPARALAFTCLGALVAIGIHAIYLVFTSRSVAEDRAS